MSFSLFRKKERKRNIPVRVIPDVLPVSALWDIAKQYRRPATKALFCACYLTGGRISEVLKMKPRDITEKEKTYMVFLTTLKNKRQHFRNLPIAKSPVTECEGYMTDFLLDYARGINSDFSLFTFRRCAATNRLRRKTFRTRGFLLKEIYEDKEFTLYPHYLRHSRLTHLVANYGFDVAHLTAFAGWTDPTPAMIYVQLAGKDLSRKLAAANELQGGGYYD